MDPEQALKSGALTRLLNSYSRGFTEGFSNLLPEIEYLSQIFLTISFGLYAIAFMIGAEGLSSLGEKLISSSIWLHLVKRYDYYSKTFIDSMIRAGLIAGNEPLVDSKVLLDPSTIIAHGFTSAQPLLEKVKGVSIFAPLEALSFHFAVWVVVAAYAIIALHAMATHIEYVVGLAAGAILMPFGLLKATRWVAMKPMSYMLALGVRHMVLALIYAKSAPLLANIVIDPKESTDLALVAAEYMALLICYCAWVVPTRVSQGLMAGSATMHGAQLAGASLGGAQTVASVVSRQLAIIQKLAAPGAADRAQQVGKDLGQKVAAKSSFVGNRRGGAGVGAPKPRRQGDNSGALPAAGGPKVKPQKGGQ